MIGSTKRAELFAPPTDEAITMIEGALMEVQKQSGTLEFNATLDAPTILGLMGEIRALRRLLLEAQKDPTHLENMVLPAVDVAGIRGTRAQLEEVCLRMEEGGKRYFAGQWIQRVNLLYWKIGNLGDHQRLPAFLDSLGGRIQLQGGQA